MEDNFCKKFVSEERIMQNMREVDELWLIGTRSLVPRVGNIQEDLFHLAHDMLGYYGFDKSYAALRESYYWPNMRRDLEESYIPGCEECQRNKSSTQRHNGPLHPLPVPDNRGDSIAMDFVGPLPEDGGFDILLTISDRLGSDICLIATQSNDTAEQTAAVFFDKWFCKNGMPLEIYCDRNKLWTSKFWRALQSSGVHSKRCREFASHCYWPSIRRLMAYQSKQIRQSSRHCTTMWIDNKKAGARLFHESGLAS